MVPIDDLAPEQWPRTEAGSLVYRAKYRSNDEALDALSGRLSEIVAKHEIYSAAELVLTVPGHISTAESFGGHLAYDVARKIGLPIVKTECSLAHRPEAKSGVETAELESAFSVPSSVEDKVVLIVDDLYRTGTTMGAVAQAAKRAGARGRLGLVASRTLSN